MSVRLQKAGLVVIKFKKLSREAVTPSYAKPGDAGLDLTATYVTVDAVNGIFIYGTGLAVEIPDGHVGLIFPRSSVCKTDLTLANSVGVIDSGYRGEIKFQFRGDTTFGKHYRPGDRVGQLVVIPHPRVTLQEVDDLGSTERGAGGFGSSGQ